MMFKAEVVWNLLPTQGCVDYDLGFVTECEKIIFVATPCLPSRA